MDDQDEKKRTEQNLVNDQFTHVFPEHGLPLSYLYLIVSSGKSEAELTNNRIALDVLKLTTDRHEASRGLSATAGLVVS